MRITENKGTDVFRNAGAFFNHRFMKLTAVSLVIAICFSVCAFAFDGDDNDRLNYLLLGDSIAYGYGIDNPDEACYGRIVANTNGYNYKNLARTARTSQEQLDLIRSDEEYRRAAEQADIISISIGANDYFTRQDVVFIGLSAAIGVNMKLFYEIADQFKENYEDIMDEILALNPDAVILAQTQYVSWYGIAEGVYGKLADVISAGINNAREKYPDNIFIVDVSGKMSGHKEYIADDSVHPNAAGNVAIAEAVLEKLAELGLGTETQPVIATEGIDYDFFRESFPAPLGVIFEFLFKLLTGYLF